MSTVKRLFEMTFSVHKYKEYIVTDIRKTCLNSAQVNMLIRI